MFDRGERSEICPKLKIMIGRAKLKADIVSIKDSFMAKKVGKKTKILFQNFCV